MRRRYDLGVRMRAFLLLLHVLGEAFTISSSFMLCPARPIRPTLVATPVHRPEACPTTPQHLLNFLGSVRLSLCFRLSASFDNDADGGNSESNEEDSHPIVAPSPETSTAPTQRLVGSEGMATISPFRSGSTYNSGAPALGVDPTRPPSYSPEESAFVEMKVDRMLVRKIDLWPPEEIFELMPLLMKGTYFEYALVQRLEYDQRLDGTPLVPSLASSSSKERRRLEHSRSFLASLKYSEEQRLARQWIEGLLEAATESTEAMDEKVFELLAYEGGVLVGPVQEALATMLRRLRSMSPDEKTLTQVVIETLQKRVEAEVQTQEMPFVRLLALLLRLPSPEDRERILRTELRNSRVVEEFAAYLEEGADYVARLRLGPYSLPDDTPEEMKKILAILRGFTRTGRKGEREGVVKTAAGHAAMASSSVSRLGIVDVEELRGRGEGGEGGLPPPPPTTTTR
ncbi:hypothetical protein VYU27_002243 [Nannochloropsis oceanica]